MLSETPNRGGRMLHLATAARSATGDGRRTVAIVLAIVGQGDGLNAWLGWAYVALRVVHSLVQATANKVTLRFAVFVASSLVLLALIVHAAIALF